MGVWYRAGTVAVTSGSKTVTGTGTQWQNLIFGVAPGVTFYGPDGKPYEIDTVNSNTSLTLATNYSGATASGQAYAIDPTRSGSVASLAAQTSEVLKFSQKQFTQIQTWFTGAANANVTLESPAGQTITVPSYSKVTSEGEGQAARAKTEADKAAASAALAGDIVVASALPLPDVWAPLSDSLRLITGYGRDVLVGSDVVARMVNFSRNSTATYIGKDGQLKTAAANEPRFEKEGLLIEGQSQNIIPISNFPQNLASWSTPNPTGNLYSYVAAPDGTSSAVKVSFAGDGFNQPFPSLVVGTVYTFSFYAKNETATDVNVSIMLGSGSGAGAVRIPANTAWTRYSVTRTFQAGDSTLRWYFSTKNVEVSLWGTQLEALPFASSYIPTNGAAVTRAADVCWIPNALNVTPDYGDITIAMEVRRNLAIPSSVFPRAIHISDRQFVVADSARIMARGGGAEQVNISTAAPGTRERIAATIKGSTIACFLNGTKATLPQTPILPVSNGTSCFIGSRNGLDGLFGHVRNVRIWQRTLSDEQIKAAA